MGEASLNDSYLVADDALRGFLADGDKGYFYPGSRAKMNLINERCIDLLQIIKGRKICLTL